jgi:hypothetical protein
MTKVTYQSSKGPVEIATMPLRYARNALDKLMRDEPGRAGEIATLGEHVAKLAKAMDESDNERVTIGGNNPPEPTPLEHHTDAIDTLYMEGKNWLDGSKIANQAQADEVTRLRNEADKAGKAAEARRVELKKPHDDAAKAVQAAWKPLVDKAAKLSSTATSALTAWLVSEQNRKRAEAAELEKLAREAEETARKEHQEAAQTGDLAALEEAESALDNAALLEREARLAERFKPQAKVEGMDRAVGLRTVYDVALSDADDAGQQLARYFWQTQRTQVIDFYLELAREAVRKGGRTIPGCNVTARQVAR